MKKTLAFLLALLPAVAVAQTFPTVPSQTVIGRTAAGAGPAQAIPFTQLSAQFCSNFTLTLKGCVPAPGSTTGRYLSDDIVTPWKSIPTQAVTAGAGVSLSGVCSGNAINCQVSATAATQLVLPSRASAAGQNLSALSAIRTLGYATPGDGGGAVFKNISSSPFTDSFVNGLSILSTGSGCANGTYYVWSFNGGTGNGATALITIAGNILTSVTATGSSIGVGNGYTAGDVLTPQTGTSQQPGGSALSCGVYPTVGVTSVSAPVCSFTDSSGTRWQMVQEGALDVRQCGAKVDCPPLSTGGCTTASATDDFTAIQAALNFGARPLGLIVGNGGLNGTEVQSPSGWSYVSAPLVVPQGVKWRGRGQWSTGIQWGTAVSAASHLITMCDSQSQLACFGSMIEGLSLNGAGSGNAGTAVFFSNNIQQADFLRNVIIVGGNRGCILLTNGYGGAAYIGMVDIEAGANNLNNPCISVSYSSAIVKMVGMVIEVPGSLAQTAIAVTGGHLNLQSFHTEGYQTGVFLNIAPGAGMGQLMNLTGGGGCTSLVVRQGGSAANVHVIGRAYRGGCTNALNNAGALTAVDIVADTVF